jgi:hypothetical protein
MRSMVLKLIGAKSPPGLESSDGIGEGITLSPVNEYLQRKALIATVQQVRKNGNTASHDANCTGARIPPPGKEILFSRQCIVYEYQREKQRVKIPPHGSTKLWQGRLYHLILQIEEA